MFENVRTPASIILTVHNKDWLIKNVLDNILQNTPQPFEIIVVLDGCTDKTEYVVEEWFRNAPSNVICHIMNTPDVFETKANNAGLKIAHFEMCFIVQDDMIIKTPNWTQHMMQPLQQWNDVFAVTARTAHNWRYNPNNVMDKNNIEYIPGRWSDILEHYNHSKTEHLSRHHFSIRSCVNRGPLLIRKSVLQQMNFLDEAFSPQDMDDHDLCYRTYAKLKLKCGAIGGVVIQTDDRWGGTRDYKTGQPREWLLKSNQKNVRMVWERHKDQILNERHDEERTITTF